jgi:biotin synthesis protein BioG
MDEHPVRFLQSDQYDVLMLYDYSSIVPDIDLQQLFIEYKSVSLVSWSMGVWAGQQLFSGCPDVFAAAIALNGTLCPIDDCYGIPEETVRGTLANLDEKSRLKFYYRMFRDRELYREFLKQQPRRSVADQRKELTALLHTAVSKGEVESIYTTAIVSDRDLVMPTKNQLRFWPGKRVKLVDGSHFLFYSYDSWDELIVKAGGITS